MVEIDSRYSRGYGAAFGSFFLLLLYTYTYSYGCFLSLVIPLILFSTLSYGLAQKRVLERRCFAQCYFYKNTFFYTLLHRKIFPYLLSGFFVIFTLPFFLGFLVLHSEELVVYLALDLFVLVSLYYFLDKKLASRIKQNIRSILVAAISSWINAFLLVVLFAIYSYYAPIPYDLFLPFEDNLSISSKQIISTCEITRYLLSLYAELHFLGWFVWDYLTTIVEDPTLISLFTLFFLLGGMIVFYLLSRFILESVRLTDLYFTKDEA